MQDYQTFAIQCQQEIELSTKSNFLSNSISEEPKRELATQVHQVVLHSATHNFSFPISYYGINTMTAHNLNTLIFSLAAKLECLGIHTYGSIRDGAGENRTHIKSFDWYASTWSLGDIVEVDFNKKFYSAEIVNFNHDRTQFSVHYLDCGSSKTITVDRALIRPPMTKKSKWNFNEMCEFKNPQDNQWYPGIITNTDSGTQTLQVEISGVVKGISMWKITEKEAIMLLRPVYDAQELSTCHKTINPITGEEWFFISDPTHVFKKLRNNLSKSHVAGNNRKNSREITFNGKEISWKHIQGVYEHTCRHATAKATKLTKRHIWLTSWSKMRVDLAEHTLSKEVEDALASIEELKEISEGTQVSNHYIRKCRHF